MASAGNLACDSSSWSPKALHQKNEKSRVNKSRGSHSRHSYALLSRSFRPDLCIPAHPLLSFVLRAYPANPSHCFSFPYCPVLSYPGFPGDPLLCGGIRYRVFASFFLLIPAARRTFSHSDLSMLKRFNSASMSLRAVSSSSANNSFELMTSLVFL